MEKDVVELAQGLRAAISEDLVLSEAGERGGMLRSHYWYKG
jgi:hypothetical protein